MTPAELSEILELAGLRLSLRWHRFAATWPAVTHKGRARRQRHGHNVFRFQTRAQMVGRYKARTFRRQPCLRMRVSRPLFIGGVVSTVDVPHRYRYG